MKSDIVPNFLIDISPYLINLMNTVISLCFIILSIKRLHDVNLSGLYVLIPTIFIILPWVVNLGILSIFILPCVIVLPIILLASKKGTVGPNRFGEDPIALGGETPK